MKAAIQSRLDAINNKGRLAGAAMLTLVVSNPAAAAIDVSDVTSAFGDLTTALVTVGGLIIGAAAVAITFKWVKGMIFS